MAYRRLLAACVTGSVLSILVSAYLHSSISFYTIYSDIQSFWYRDWVAAGQVPYLPGSFLEYPPLAGAVLYASRIMGGYFASAAGSIYAGYFDSFSALSLVAGAGMGWSCWRLAKALGHRLNPLYFFLPSMLVYGVYNFDLFNALFIVLSVQFFAEKRRGWSAAFLGLAIAAKLVAVVLIPVFLLDIDGWRERGRYLAVSAEIAFAWFIPIIAFDFGYFHQFLSFFSGWGLEDAWYIWIFGDPFSSLAKAFGYGLFAILILRVYTMKMPLVQRSFLALSAYLLATTIYAPQFNLMLVPLAAALALTSPWLVSMEAFNALIILTWFTVPNPTSAGTLPQAMALLRTASLALLALSVAAQSGHSLTGWMRARVGRIGLPIGGRNLSSPDGPLEPTATAKPMCTLMGEGGRHIGDPEGAGLRE